ncbi:MAG: AMMECR1 domain-containing protein [Chloroflexi bacterium RBG_13_56_8]|nr:MAG: AMMECR1 domain-containing protein [Chloroflexi bacterium RBG_13_56_8]
MADQSLSHKEKLMTTEEHPLVQLARQTITSYIREGICIEPPEELNEEMKPRAGVFVSLHRHGELRGCIGTIEPVQRNVAEEVIANAISAATRDPRFPALTPRELEDLEISVDVLTAPEPISSPSELDPQTCGVIVQCGRRRGLLLPDLEGVDTAQQQIDIALRKAWITANEPYRLFRFHVIRYH